MRLPKDSLVAACRAALCVAFAAATGGCGDGIGRPIVGSGASASGRAGGGIGGISGTSASADGGLGGRAAAGGLGEASGSAGMSGLGGRGGAGGAPSSAGSMSTGARMGQGGCFTMDGRGGPPSNSFDMWPNDCTGQGGDPGSSRGDVPDTDYCQDAADWDPTWTCFEDAILAYINQMRAMGSPCGDGSMGTAPGPLMMVPELRCSARLHSIDMSERNDLAYDADGYGARIKATGYHARLSNESVLRWDQGGPMDHSHGLDILFGSGGDDTRNLFDPGFNSIGVGLYDGYLTLDFAGP